MNFPGFDHGDAVEVSLRPSMNFRGFGLGDAIEVSLCLPATPPSFDLGDEVGANLEEMSGRQLFNLSIGWTVWKMTFFLSLLVSL